MTGLLGASALAVLSLHGCEEQDLLTAPDESRASELSIAGTRFVIGLGSTVRLQASPRNARGRAVPGYSIKWSASDPSIVSTEEDGYVTALALGSTTITAVAEKEKGSRGRGKEGAPGQLKKEAEVVVDPTPVASVEIVPTETTVEVDASVSLLAIVEDADGNELADRVVYWSSSDPSVATVDERGTVIGVSVGTVEITATSEGQTGRATVTVREPSPVVDAAVWPPQVTLGQGQVAQLYAALLHADGSVTCLPDQPSRDLAVLFNAGAVAGCDSAKSLLDYSKASGASSFALAWSPPAERYR